MSLGPLRSPELIYRFWRFFTWEIVEEIGTIWYKSVQTRFFWYFYRIRRSRYVNNKFLILFLLVQAGRAIFPGKDIEKKHISIDCSDFVLVPLYQFFLISILMLFWDLVIIFDSIYVFFGTIIGTIIGTKIYYILLYQYSFGIRVTPVGGICVICLFWRLVLFMVLEAPRRGG